MKILFRIIKGIITIFLCAVLLVVILQKFTKNRIALGNIYVFQVVSESMLPHYKIGDIIVTKKVNPVSLEVGDDVTYVASASGINGMTITHRIVSKRYDYGKYYFVTKGTNNAVEDEEISEDNIYGKVIYKTVLFSFVGRLMTNIVIYYALFVSVGVAFSYEIVTSFFIKDKEKE